MRPWLLVAAAVAACASAQYSDPAPSGQWREWWRSQAAIGAGADGFAGGNGDVVDRGRVRAGDGGPWLWPSRGPHEQAWAGPDGDQPEADAWDADTEVGEPEIVSPLSLRAAQWGRCGLCETQVQLLLNGLVNTAACGRLKHLISAASKIVKWGVVVKTGLTIFCGVCRGVTNGQCTWRYVATNACRRHGYCT